MKIKFETVKDVLSHASSFILHDVEEVTKLQCSAFSDVDNFAISAYKKAFIEIRTGLRKLFRYVNIIHPEDIPFKTFDGNGRIKIGQYLAQNKPTLGDISVAMGTEKGNDAGMYHFTVNPISNMPAFRRGINNFTCDLFVHQKNADGNFTTSGVYSYNPIENEALVYRDNCLLLNDYRLTARDVTSLKTAVCSIVLQGVANLVKVPKDLLHAGYVLFNDDFSSSIKNLFANRVNFVVHCNLHKHDLLWLEIAVQAGYLIARVGKTGELHIIENAADVPMLDISSKAYSYIIATRKNMIFLGK